MKFVEEIKIKHNRSRLIVGKIVSLDVKDEMLNNDGFIDLYKSQIATISGCDGYSFPVKNERKGYQKPRKSNKSYLPTKECPVCNRPFTWRKNGKEIGKM